MSDFFLGRKTRDFDHQTGACAETARGETGLGCGKLLILAIRFVIF
jgi:hypothetical protein